jgi:predicted ATPase
MIKMDFLISDLHHHIDQLHEEQFGSQSSNKIFTVYRGQGVSKNE